VVQPIVRLRNNSCGLKYAALVAALLLAAACSDAATRVAYDIESNVNKLGSAEGSRAEIVHMPRSWPEGCSGSYTMRISKGRAIATGHNNFHIAENSGGLAVGCYTGSGNRGGWGTTYHLRFVDVPATVEVTKNTGEATVIELQRIGARAVVVGLR